MDMEILLPAGPEPNMQLADPSLVNYYHCIDNRILWVDAEIDIALLEITRWIMKWNIDDKDVPVEDRIPIKVFIFSPGGNLAETMHACSVIQMSKTPVWTVNMGAAMSGGFLLLISGHKRFTMPYARAMAHLGSGGAGGTFRQAKDAMADYEDQIDDLKAHILKCTSITTDELTHWEDRDWYMGAEAMIANGVVDQVVENLDEIL